MHNTTSSGILKESRRASGKPWGGAMVQHAFIAWLADLFGKETMTNFKDSDEFRDLVMNFETKMRCVSSQSTNDVCLRIPCKLHEAYVQRSHEDLKTRLRRLKLDSDVKIPKGDILRVSADIFRNWFQEPLNQAIHHITDVLAEPAMKDVSAILLVGELADCPLVQEAVKVSAGNRNVVIPKEPGFAALKGAVLYGHQLDE